MKQLVQDSGRARKMWLVALLVTALLSTAYGVAWHLTMASHSSQGPSKDDFQIYGTDFLCFYSVAKLVLTGIPSVYNHEAMWAEQARITGLAGFSNPRYIFGYSPPVAALLSPLGRLSYPGAYYTWLLCSLLLAALAVSLVVPVRGSWVRRLGVSLFVPLGLPFFAVQVLGSGQLSAVAMLIFASVVALRERRPFAAGLVFSLGIYKPPLFVVYALVALLMGERRFIAGAATGAAALVALSLAAFGVEAHAAFFNVASGYFYGGQLPGGQQLPPSKGMGLLSALASLTGSISAGWLLFVGCVVALLWTHLRLFASSARKSSGPDSLLEQASRITLSYFLSIQALNYDASVLLIPALLVVSFMLRSKLPQVTCWIITLIMILLAVSGTRDSENGAGVSLACAAVGMHWLAVVLAKLRSEGAAPE